MSDIRHMSIAKQRLVDFISMVTNSTLLCNNTGANSTVCDYKLWKEPAISVGSALTLQLRAVTDGL
jgi:hypothetical protein